MAPLVETVVGTNGMERAEILTQVPTLKTQIGTLARHVIERTAPREYAASAAANEAIETATISSTSDGCIAVWSGGAEHLCGRSAQEMIGQPIERIIAPDRRKEFRRLLTMANGGTWIDDFKTVFVSKDHHRREVAVSIAPIACSTGDIVGVSLTARDLSGQAPMPVTRAMAARPTEPYVLAELAAALAHELNQPLTAIVNYMKAARRKMDHVEGPEAKIAREYTDKAAGQAMRAALVIRRVRDFVSHGQILPKEENIEDVVLTALEMAADNLDGVTIHKHFASTMSKVSIDRIQIEQVIVNLIRNAAEAMQDIYPREITIATAQRDHSFVQVSVSDTGLGLPEKIARRLFEPFVTSKKGGMGVGLVISRSVVEKHGGRMWAARNLNGGATFSFLLPTRAVSE